MGPLMGTNKAAWGVKLLLTTVSSYQADWQFVCPTEDIALLFASLWMVLPAFSFPPTPSAHAHPLYNSSLILQDLKKTITKTSSASCVTELVIIL